MSEVNRSTSANAATSCGTHARSTKLRMMARSYPLAGGDAWRIARTSAMKRCPVPLRGEPPAAAHSVPTDIAGPAPCMNDGVLFLSFPYVCPEPVLVQ
jgi:hypothetical protein